MIGEFCVWDTHIHIVPGVDDGSGSIQESLEMLRMEERQGVDCVIATPHSYAFDYDSDLVKKRYEELKRAASEAGIDGIKLMGLGCEMHCTRHTVDECLEKLEMGVYPTIGKRVLTEFETSWFGLDEAVYCVEKLVDAGYIPVIAHIERYEFTDAMAALVLRGKGAEIQVNAYSLANDPSISRRRLTTELVKKGLVDHLGSDAHRLHHRPPVVEDGARKFLNLTSQSTAMNTGSFSVYYSAQRA